MCLVGRQEVAALKTHLHSLAVEVPGIDARIRYCSTLHPLLAVPFLVLLSRSVAMKEW